MHTPQVSNSAGHEVLLRHARGLNRKEVRQLVMIGRENAWHPLPFLFNKPSCNSGRQTAARHGPPAAVQAGCSKPVRHARSDVGDDVRRQTAGFVAGPTGTACPSNQLGLIGDTGEETKMVFVCFSVWASAALFKTEQRRRILLE